MSDRPTYKELEQRISILENQLEQYSGTSGLFDDTGLFSDLFQKDPDLIIVAKSDQAGQLGVGFKQLDYCPAHIGPRRRSVRSELGKLLSLGPSGWQADIFTREINPDPAANRLG